MNRRLNYFLVSFTIFFMGCSAITTIPRAEPKGFIVLKIDPPKADILIDEQYVGTANDFENGIRVRVGAHRVMIRYQGYETERFDIDVQSGEEVTLLLQMVASIDVEAEERAPRRSFLKRAKKEP